MMWNCTWAAREGAEEKEEQEEGCGGVAATATTLTSRQAKRQEKRRGRRGREAALTDEMPWGISGGIGGLFAKLATAFRTS